MNYASLLRVLCSGVFAFLIAVPTQAATVAFTLSGSAGEGLLPGNENPPVASSGSGGAGPTGISFDDVSNLLSVDIVWGSGNGFTDLTSTVSAAHIHGPADAATNGGVLYPLHTLAGFDTSATSGGFTGAVNIGAGDVDALLAGLTYINIHTTSNPSGEIRGQLMVPNLAEIPIPPAFYLLASGLIGLTGIARRRAIP